MSNTSSNKNSKYNLTARILHWLMAVMIIAVFSLGIAIDKLKDNNYPNITTIYQIHKIGGVLILLLLTVRIFNRLISKAPKLNDKFTKLETFLIKIGHFILYLLMIIAPLSGYLMSGFAGYPIMIGNYQLPAPIPNFTLAKIFSEVHEIATFSLIILAVIHLLFAMKHRFFDIKEKNILDRML